jgi:hypothetical protein
LAIHLDNHPRSSSTSPQDFLERLQRHPDLHAEFAALLDIVENASGDASKADDAEERVAHELQRLGQQAIISWALRKQQKVEAECEARSDLARKEKKSSTGTAATAKSK